VSSYDLGGESSTTMAAHSNLIEQGKGKGLQAEECFTVWSCYKCHSLFDQGGSFSREEKNDLFYEALLRQIEEWRKIATNPALKPWKVEAARQVLDHLINLYREDTEHG